MWWRDQVVAMLDQRKWPIDWIESEIASGSIALLENETAVIGVEKRVYPGGYTELHGVFAVGEMADILLLIDSAVEAAKVRGFDGASISSKPAWGRILKSRGFVPYQLNIVKELGDVY